jgi:hypothetical protein
MGFINSTQPTWITTSNVKFYSGLQYGKTNITNLDIIVPTDAQSATPLIINIHGGSFIFGDKADIYDTNTEQNNINAYLAEGIAYASINYTLINQFYEKSGIKRCFDSSVLAIQFLKYYADLFNIDKNKVAINGGSAGGGIGLWIGLSNDLADLSSLNLIKREDTRVNFLALNIAQATYDLVKWESDVFADAYPSYSLELDYNTNGGTRDSINRTYGIESYSELFIEPTLSLRSELDMIRLIDGNTKIPPTYLYYDNILYPDLISNTIIDSVHSDYMGKTIMDKMESNRLTTPLTFLGTLGIDNTGDESKEKWLIKKLKE